MTSFVTAILSRDHDRNCFHSGVEALDRYLREFAFQDMKRRVAGCFVMLDDAGEIAGFYTLAATSVPLNLAPPAVTKKLPLYPVAPAMLIGRLAVATKRQGQGVGRALIADAIIRTESFRIGAYALIVDAKNERARLLRSEWVRATSRRSAADVSPNGDRAATSRERAARVIRCLAEAPTFIKGA